MRFRNYVNEAKRTCVVVIDDTEDDVIKRVAKVMRGNNYNETFYFRGSNSYLLGPFRGKAKCCPEDAWDPDEGLRIARDRAIAKYNRAFNREIDYILERLEALSFDLEDLYKEEIDEDDLY
jgi:hypothetical protein